MQQGVLVAEDHANTRGMLWLFSSGTAVKEFRQRQSLQLWSTSLRIHIPKNMLVYAPLVQGLGEVTSSGMCYNEPRIVYKMMRFWLKRDQFRGSNSG